MRVTGYRVTQDASPQGGETGLPQFGVAGQVETQAPEPANPPHESLSGRALDDCATLPLGMAAL